ncbi:MAG: DinB family protein [Ignavibacteria bacterium]|nr:DinB family protein [Ignavibacteria bacterium]
MMFRSISDFSYTWEPEIERTQKILKHMTNASMSQTVDKEGRTLGRIAWHLTTSIPEMMNRTGLKITRPGPEDPVPATAREVFQAYNEAAIALMSQVQSEWTDASLDLVDEMYGEHWKRSKTLQVLVFHQIHHRGQMTVLMRQAGLQIPGIFGPARQEWAQWGMEPPKV